MNNPLTPKAKPRLQPRALSLVPSHMHHLTTQTGRQSWSTGAVLTLSNQSKVDAGSLNRWLQRKERAKQGGGDPPVPEGRENLPGRVVIDRSEIPASPRRTTSPGIDRSSRRLPSPDSSGTCTDAPVSGRRLFFF